MFNHNPKFTWSRPGFERRTSCTQSENHIPRPSSHYAPGICGSLIILQSHVILLIFRSIPTAGCNTNTNSILPFSDVSRIHIHCLRSADHLFHLLIIASCLPSTVQMLLLCHNLLIMLLLIITSGYRILGLSRS